MEIIVTNGKKTEDGEIRFDLERKTIVSFYRLQTGKIPILETNYTSFASFYPLSDKKKKNSPVETNRHFNVLIRGTKEHKRD